MTIFERLEEYTEDEMVNFLYNFARDIITNFGNFIMPSQDSIRRFLDSHIPGTDDEENDDE